MIYPATREHKLEAVGMDVERLAEKWIVMTRFAQDLATLSVCKDRKVGCVVFDSHASFVYSIGYNGPPVGFSHADAGSVGEEPSGDQHAETNALIKLAPRSVPLLSCVMAVTCPPCRTCCRNIIQSGAIGLVILGDDVYDKYEPMLLPSHGVMTVGVDDLRKAVSVNLGVANYTQLRTLINKITERNR